MSRTITALVLAIFYSPAWAGNFATCILDKLPGAANQPTHGAVFQVCTKEYPTRYIEVEKGSGRGLFGFKDGASCIMKKARETPFELSAMQIGFACRCLYDAPQFEKQMCAY